MVGVPRSAGCQLCVKRRVKCDQTRPSCGKCAKYGAECPGYDRPLKFVAGKHQVRARRQEHSTRSASESRASVSASEGGLTLPGPSTTGDIAADAPSTSSVMGSEIGRLARLTITDMPVGDRGQTICAVLENLSQTQAAKDFWVFAPWFSDMPPHLGRKVVLDSAVAAFSLHLLGKARDDEVLVHESRCIYGQSLVALQKALNHPVEWKSSETLSATMILCLFEVGPLHLPRLLEASVCTPRLMSASYKLFAGTTSSDSWMKHAAGVSWLMQQRGSEAHKDPWDRSMLRSFRALTIMNSLFSGLECFLAKRNWRKVLADPDADTEHQAAGATATALHAIDDLYWTMLARLPDIVHRGYALREARRHGMPIDTSQVVILVRRAEKLHSEIAALYARYTKLAPRPTEVPSADPGSIHETVFSYSDVWHGSFHMSFWATLIILQECLVQCQYPVDYTASNRELASNIFRSVEYVGAGMMGPFRVGYPIRIAYEFADVRTQLWVASVLARFEKHYAATSHSTYPEVENNEHMVS